MSYVLSELNKRGVPPLLHNIETMDQWKVKREEILKRWHTYIGGIPDRVPVKYDVLFETKETDYMFRKIIYNTVFGDQVTANLLVPHAVLENGGNTAAVLALHGTNGLGKDNVTTRKGKKNRKYGMELAKRGYVVLAPDALSAGDRIYDGYEAFHNAPFYEQYPNWSSVAKNFVDHKQGIDLLCELEFVKTDAIGAIGHSFGGYNAYFLGLMDRRIKAIVCSCGFCTFTGDYRPEQWGVRDWYTHMPKISESLQEGRIPFEFHEVMALAAPTPLFNWSGQSDQIFPHWQAIGSGLLEVYRLYQWLGVEDKFYSLIGASGHDFPPEIRKMAYAFLDKWLKK